MFYTEGENTIYEVFKFNNGKKIIIYLKKVGNDLLIVSKPFSTHLLEQIFDQDNNLISQEFKLSHHKIDTNWIINSINDDYD